MSQETSVPIPAAEREQQASFIIATEMKRRGHDIEDAGVQDKIKKLSKLQIKLESQGDRQSNNINHLLDIEKNTFLEIDENDELKTPQEALSPHEMMRERASGFRKGERPIDLEEHAKMAAADRTARKQRLADAA